jgi:hypothetical protein
MNGHRANVSCDRPTGFELIAEIEAAARQRGITPRALILPLYPDNPSAALNTIKKACHPTGRTVAKVRAMIAGEPIPREMAPVAAPKRAPVTDGQRRVAARSTGSSMSIGLVLALDRPPAPTMPTVVGDPRPPAWSREPCRVCATRGDLGCAHQRPFEEVSDGVR